MLPIWSLSVSSVSPSAPVAASPAWIAVTAVALGAFTRSIWSPATATSAALTWMCAASEYHCAPAASAHTAMISPPSPAAVVSTRQ